jgi:hypothetical protein
VKIPWHKRFQQLFAPQQFQAAVLAGHSDSSMVQVQKQIGFTNFVMPNDPELVREAFAGELDGTTLQSDIKSFGEYVQACCSNCPCICLAAWVAGVTWHACELSQCRVPGIVCSLPAAPQYSLVSTACGCLLQTKYKTHLTCAVRRVPPLLRHAVSLMGEHNLCCLLPAKFKAPDMCSALCAASPPCS